MRRTTGLDGNFIFNIQGVKRFLSDRGEAFKREEKLNGLSFKAACIMKFSRIIVTCQASLMS
jgi:hypothetical protein